MPVVVNLPSTVQRAIDLIVVHCSDTPSGQWLGGVPPGQPGYRTAALVIDEWHGNRQPPFNREPTARQAFNWRLAHIGYHFVIDLDGYVWTGRSLEEVGAHVKGFNAHSIGICMVGGSEREGRYSAAQWASLAALVSALSNLIAPNANARAKVRLCGHRDLSPDTDHDGIVEPREWLKTCPGFEVEAWVRNNVTPLPQHVLPAA